MKKIVVIVAVLVFAATAVASVKILHDQRLASRTLEPAEQFVRIDPQYVYDVMPGAKMRTFNLASDVTLKKPGAAARLVFDFADVQNHHYVEITPTTVRLVVMQDGVGRVLESVEGRSFPLNEPLRVTVKRRELMIRVAVNGELAAEACDETFYSGKAGTAVVEGEAEASKPKLQPVAEIYFADDFMRAPEEAGTWVELRGSWKVSEITNASMSSNAFQYVAQGGDEAAAVAGLPFWDDYSFEASVKPTRSAAVGLYFYYRDENNYFRFEWTPEESGKPGSGMRRLVRMFGGKSEVLAEQPGGFRANQWYKLMCQATGRRVRAFIDDTLVFDVTDAHLVGGMIGLYSGAEGRAFFDDVFVRSHRWFEDRFTNGGRTAWSYLGGDWKRETVGTGAVADNAASPAAAPSGVLTVRAPKGEARAAVGGENWKNYVLETDIHPDAIGRAGVLLYYQDETRYVQASFEPSADGKETWTLERVLDDRRDTLDRAVIDAPKGAHNVRAGVADGHIRVQINGRAVLEGFVPSLTSGRGGLFAADAALVSFGPVRVDWPLEEPPLLTLNEIFEHEDSMSNWSTVESDWFLTSKNVWVNKGNFPGDAAIEAGVTSFGKSSELALVLSAEGAAEGSGYVLRLAATPDGTGPPALELTRRGKTVASGTVDGADKVARFALKRVGHFLVGEVNRKVALVHRDAEMLAGDALGWYARSAKVDARSVSVSSPNVRKDLFRKAHTDWRVVKGIWEVSNRWECDRRWTFFSGRTSWQLAAIWNKRPLEGDMTLDFYAGPKMDKDKLGGRYENFADINCTIAGDGVDLASGYSFLFGGYKNTKTVLVKGDRILAEAKWPANARQAWMKEGQPAIIPTAALNIHHTWFHVKAQKAGNRLRLYIDDELIIDYTDNDAPLTGNRVALWTWNSGIMVARVTLVADRLGPCEPPDAYVPSQCRCVYDTPAGS